VKAALLVGLVASVALAHATPSREHPLDDAAHVVPDSDEPDLEAELRALRADTDVALGVVIIPTTGGQSIEAYARSRREEWSQGTTPAALFVLAVTDRRSRLEVNDVLRDKFPDARAQAILDNLRGYLRASDYSAAIRAVIREVRNGATGLGPDLESPHLQSSGSGSVGPGVPLTTPEPPPVSDEPHETSNLGALLAVVFGVALFVLISWMWARGRVASRATVSGDGVHVGPSVLAETFLCMGLILGGIIYIALIALASSAGSDSSSSSSGSWGSSSSGGSSGSSGSGGWSGGGSGGSGGWSGGGASSSW
jgi:uncharacterized protein